MARDDTVTHTLMGGKLHVYRRENSTAWQCSTYINGKNHRVSTKSNSLSHAKDFAHDWYLELHGKLRRGELKVEKTFKDAAAQFEREYEVITEGTRSPAYVRGHKDRIRLHLMPFFGKKPLSEITAGQVQEYRIHRRTSDAPPARTTLHHEIVTLRQVLKTAIRHGWLTHLPDFSTPYRSAGKVVHRAWFSREEYNLLVDTVRDKSTDLKNHRRKSCAELLDYILIMSNTGVRPDEAARLEYRDVKIVDDVDTNERILEISVRGKRGFGYCKSTQGAVFPFQRLMERAQPEPTDRLFPHRQTMLLNRILRVKKVNLKLDRDGQVRTAYSLRHTYICFRLLEGADIYQIAKNCRTSVEMIQKHYAAHIQTALDASAINRRKKQSKEVKEANV